MILVNGVTIARTASGWCSSVITVRKDSFSAAGRLFHTRCSLLSLSRGLRMNLISVYIVTKSNDSSIGAYNPSTREGMDWCNRLVSLYKFYLHARQTDWPTAMHRWFKQTSRSRWNIS